MKKFENPHGDELAFLRWIIENKEDWNFICGVKPATDADLKRLHHALIEEGKRHAEFDVLFNVFLTIHYERIMRLERDRSR